MKKSILAIAACAALMFTACGQKETITTDVKVLPEAAQNLLTDNFAGVNVAQIKVEKEMSGNEYEVTLANGAKVDFNADGSIDKVIAAPNGVVPSALLPDSINAYIAKNYPNEQVVKYDLDKDDQEATLTNGFELKFDLQGNFIKLDIDKDAARVVTNAAATTAQVVESVKTDSVK